MTAMRRTAKGRAQRTQYAACVQILLSRSSEVLEGSITETVTRLCCARPTDALYLCGGGKPRTGGLAYCAVPFKHVEDLVAVDVLACAPGMRPDSDAMLMMWPLRRAIMSGSASWHPAITP